MKELLPNPFAVDYSKGRPLDLYTEKEMYEFCVRVLNKVMLKINEEQDYSDHKFVCKDGVHIYYKILDMLNEPWSFDNE